MTSITRKLGGIPSCQEQGQSYLPDKQTALEDRYYNNEGFQDDYPVNDPDVNTAATKIQAQFRGHRARRDFEKIKQDNQHTTNTNQQESDDDQKSPPLTSARLQQKENDTDLTDEEQLEEELTEEEKREQEQAATAIQAKFRGYQVRKNLREPFGNSNEHGQLSSQQQQQQDFENDHDKTAISPTTGFSKKIDNDRREFGGHLTAHNEIEAGENNASDRLRLERESTQLSEDFERHTQIPRDSDFDQEQLPEIPYDEDDMNDPNLDKAATRIQASYRGYKIRKELGSGNGHSNTSFDQQQLSVSPQTHDEYDNARNKNILSPSAEGNKEPVGEEDDNAAAIKIQAAYRGYRVRKDLEK